MTDTYKVLGQAITGELALDDLTTKEVVVYQVPASTQASVSSITITNSDTSSRSYRLSFVKSNEIYSNPQNVDYGLKKFVAVGSYSNQAAYSTDGINWTGSSLPSESIWDSLAYGDGKFVVVSKANNSRKAAYSTDGITWTVSTLPATGAFWESVTYGNGKFVAIAYGSSAAAYSTDGITWTASTLPASRNWIEIEYGAGKFVAAVEDSDNWAYSTDGINWTEFISSYTLPGYLQFANGKFIAVNLYGFNIGTSIDGITWTTHTIPFRELWTGITYGAGKFLLVSAGSTTAYSTDGITWTLGAILPLPTDGHNWREPSYGVDKFIVLGYATENAYSTDGITWTLGPANNFVCNKVIYGGTEVINNSLNKHYIIYNKEILSAETHEIKGGVTLSAGDQIRVYSASTEIITNVYGVEIA